MSNEITPEEEHSETIKQLRQFSSQSKKLRDEEEQRDSFQAYEEIMKELETSSSVQKSTPVPTKKAVKPVVMSSRTYGWLYGWFFAFIGISLIVGFVTSLTTSTPLGSNSVDIQGVPSQIEIANTCNFLINSLNQDQKILDEQQKSNSDLNARIAKDDPAYAQALIDYPSLSYAILYGDNWDQHALRMVTMYSVASHFVNENSEFSSTLKDSGFVWSKRLVAHQTPAGPKKDQLFEEQISLDTREGNINRPIIKQTCNISAQLLP